MATRTGERTLRYGGGRARVGPWRGHAHVAHLILGNGAPMSGDALHECLKSLRGSGYTSVVTNALSAHDADRLGTAGFEVRERLHLLEHRLEYLEFAARAPAPLRRGTRGDRAAVLRVDGQAFVDDWRLDEHGLREALRATPWTRYRVGARATRRGHHHGGRVVAYGITGRAGRQGYLQRVAVAPSTRRCGWGAAIVHDALAWLARAGVERAWVNTQLGNEAALGLYEHCGFRRRGTGLCVLTRRL